MDTESKEPTPVGANLQRVLDRLRYETLRPEPPPDFEGLVEEKGITLAVIAGKRLQIRPRPEFRDSSALHQWGLNSMPWLTEEEYQEAMAEYDRLEEEKQSQANGHARALNPSATSFARAWQEAINEFLPKHKSGEMSLGLFQEALAEVVVEHLQVSLGPRSVNRVMDVFRRHGSRATKEGVISLLQENAPVNKRLQWLEYRAKTSKWSPGKGECQ